MAVLLDCCGEEEEAELKGLTVPAITSGHQVQYGL